ncbi:hypothetical protein [Streptomyces sp. NBC_01233]|uniref:hypothetical protein n=1 Tax=Streptomyces sp. NBC_01233 TaxID=2903787 RepID=UPI002E0F5319|nr:hypothetical protein OG332_42565 [Streptomyces sp. NBC_01233]
MSDPGTGTGPGPGPGGQVPMGLLYGGNALCALLLLTGPLRAGQDLPTVPEAAREGDEVAP